jgi:fumarate reductase flavoprotein subunit
MKSTETLSAENLETDVLVIGAGGSGLAAAVAAAEKGAKVVVLEKQRQAGGTTPFAEGIVAAESPVQRRMNIETTKDELFNLHMYYSHWTLNPHLVRTLIDKSSDTVEWLENMGITFNIRGMALPGSGSTQKAASMLSKTPSVFHVPKDWGSGIVKALLKECSRLGVRILYRTRATSLLLDEGGKITGALAQVGNRTLTAKANSMIIASGGYGSNRDLMKKYCPSYDISNIDNLMIKNTHPGDRIRWVGDMHTGDGMQMAFGIGADDEGLGILLMNGPNFVAGNHAWMLAMNPIVMRINKRGERFAAENLGPFMSDNATLRQPGQTCYGVFDEAFKQRILKSGFGLISGGKYNHDATRIDDDLLAAVDRGSCIISQSFDEIADWIGAEPETLKATIREYNDSCDKGHDDLFAKDARFLQPLRLPPYYACKCYPGFLVTIGGIKINHRMEVLNKNQRPIDGLYAVGISTGGWSAATYNINLPGAGCGFPLYSGRIAGENAAKYASSLSH